MYSERWNHERYGGWRDRLWECRAAGLWLYAEESGQSERWGYRWYHWALPEPVVIWPVTAAPGDIWFFGSEATLAYDHWNLHDVYGSWGRESVAGRIRFVRRVRIPPADGPVAEGIGAYAYGEQGGDWIDVQVAGP